jgi:hypothetical protein
VFADTSDVTLTTGNPRAELWTIIQQGPGHPGRQKNIQLFHGVTRMTVKLRSMIATPFFCPAARFAVLDTLQNGDRLIASREYGLY